MSAAPHWFTSGVIARLTAAYPSWPCHVGTVQVFWDALADLPRADLERAAVAHVAQESAWPIAATLRRMAQPRELLGGLTASEAWEEMYRHRHAHTRNPKWSSPAVERAALAVNWNDPDWLSEQLPTIRAQFERYYTAIEKRQASERRYAEADKLLAFACGGDGDGNGDGPRRLFAPKGGSNGS